jgi:hypothetical protein
LCRTPGDAGSQASSSIKQADPTIDPNDQKTTGNRRQSLRADGIEPLTRRVERFLEDQGRELGTEIT